MATAPGPQRTTSPPVTASRSPPHSTLQCLSGTTAIKDTSASTLAEQFSVIDIENYEDVAPWDLILWSRVSEAERESKCPSLYRLVDRYYEIGHFVATTIVSEPEVEDRVEMITKFLDVARCANDLGNFNLMMAVYSGITHPVLKRLKTTWASMPSEKMKLLNSFIKYCDPEDNYDAMRTYIELTSTVRPVLPFLGGYLAEMSAIHTLSSDYLPSVSSSGDRLINYAKHRKLYQIISSIRRCNAKLVVRRREQVINALRRLHALPTDGIKMKVSDLQEAASYNMLDSSDSESDEQGEHGFEAVATPRYPVFDPNAAARGPFSPDTFASPILTDSSPHELYVDPGLDAPPRQFYNNYPNHHNSPSGSTHQHNIMHSAAPTHPAQHQQTTIQSPQPTPATPISASSAPNLHTHHAIVSAAGSGNSSQVSSPGPSHPRKSAKKGEILKSRSTGAFNVAKLTPDDGGTASSSGDSMANPNQSNSVGSNGSGSSPKQTRATTKTSSDGALNKRVMLKHENDTYYYYTTASGPSSTKSAAGSQASTTADVPSPAPSAKIDPQATSGTATNTLATSSGAVGATGSSNVGNEKSSTGQKSSAPITTSKRPSHRSMVSANSRSSIRSGHSIEGEEDMSDGAGGYTTGGTNTTAYPYGASSYGSHSHLYHSGGGHISAGTSPKEFISPFASAAAANAAAPPYKKELSPLRFPQQTVDAIAESDDSPATPSSGSSPRAVKSIPQHISRQNSRTTNPSPIRKQASAPTSINDRITERNVSGSTIHSAGTFHSNPTSARSAGGKGSSSIIAPATLGYPGGATSFTSNGSGGIPLLMGTGPGSVHTAVGSASSAAAMAERSAANNHSPNGGNSPGGTGNSLAYTSTATNKAELKMDSKRYRIALELLETEEDFVHYLKILVEDGIWSLRQRLQKDNIKNAKRTSSSTLNSSNPLSSSPPISPHLSPHQQVDSNTALSEEHLRIIFSNIEALYSFHSLLLEDLHNAVRFWRSGGLGSLFSQYHHGFEAYIEYTNSRHRGDLLLEALLDTPAPSTHVENDGLSAARLIQRQQEVILSKTRKANFHALLHLPVLRLPRILILLKEFKSCTSEGHVDLPILVDAISKLENIAMKLPMTQEDAEQSMLQLQVLNKITGWKDKRSKLRPGRAFLAEYDLKMLIQGTNRFPKLVALLWSDTIFFCRTKETRGTKKRKWAILGVLNLTHVHLHPLSSKQVRHKFRELSKESSGNSSGKVSGSRLDPSSASPSHHHGRPSWNKHPSIVSMKYMGLEWLLSFSSVELGEAFVADVHAASERVVGLHSTRFTKFEVGQTSPGACESAAITRVASKIYSFGGAFRGQWRNEMWAWDMDDRKWEKVASGNSANGCEPPLARTEHAMCAVGTKLYLHGGQRFGSYIDDMMVFDTETLNWNAISMQQLPPPTPSSTSSNTSARDIIPMSVHTINTFAHGAAGTASDAIKDQHPSGISSTSISTSTYHTADQSVSASQTHGSSGLIKAPSAISVASNQSLPATSTPPSPRSGHSLNAIGTKLYLFGGQWFESLHQRHLFNDLYCFDTDTQTWSEILPSGPDAYVPAARQRHAAQVIDNKLVIFGGSGLTSELCDTAIYDPETNTWHACEEAYGYIPTNRALTGSTVFGKKLILFGGSCETRVHSSASSGLSPSSSILSTVPDPRASPANASAAPPAIASSAVSAASGGGGSANNATSETFNDLFVFDVESRKWSHCWIPVELAPRRAHSIVATSSNDNTLTIMCGRMLDPDSGDSQPTAEVLLLHGLSSIINNSIGRAEKMEKMREKVEKLSQFAIHQQALLTVVGSHYVTPPPTSEGVKWDPLTTKSTFTLLENLGSLVYKAMHEPTQSLVAIKVLSHHDCSLEMLDVMAEEMQVLSRCRHPGLTAYHGFAPVSSELWIVSELAMGASLDRIQHETTTLSEKQVASVLVTLLESLAYLHSQNIVHKSIKASNVVLNADGRIKLTDWGLSPVWRPLHGSPESPAHTAANDIYDVGLMVVGLLEPYGPARQLRTRNRFAAETLDFVALCTASFAHRRPTAVQLLSHPFILPHLQNAQRDDLLRALFSDASTRNANRRTSSLGGSTTSALALGTFAVTIDRAPLDTRKPSGGGGLNTSSPSIANTIGSTRRKSSKPDETNLLMAHIEELKLEHANESEKLKSTILTLQAQNANLESRLRAIELLVSNLVIPPQ